MRTLDPRSRRHRGTPPGSLPIAVLGTGTGVPSRVLANADLERMVDTSDDWIVRRTGMRTRRIAAPGEATSDLALAAARAALDDAGLDPADVELLIVATVTPDHVCPPTAALLQHALGAPRALGFDLSAACTGFVNGLATAHAMLETGRHRNAVVIGADTLSRITDYEDRETCVLFGDGAGAVVLGAGGEGRGQILDHVLGLDGSGADLITVPAGGSRHPASAETVANRQHFLRVEGRKVFKFAVQKMVQTVHEILERNALELGDIALLVPHQANLRILEAAAEHLGLSMDRVAVQVDSRGNTSSASIPMALDEAARRGQVDAGDLLLTVGFGGGLTWGANLIEWGKPAARGEAAPPANLG